MTNIRDPRAGKIRSVMSAPCVITGRICLRGPSSVLGTFSPGKSIGTYRKDGPERPVLQVDRQALKMYRDAADPATG